MAAAGALWKLSFNPLNALRIMEAGGVIALINIFCGLSTLSCFISTLALAYMFDGRTDKISSTGNCSKSAIAEVALACIKSFLMNFSSHHAFSAASSMTPEVLAELTNFLHIKEASNLICSGVEIGRLVEMLRNPSPVLKGCAAFALLQFTFPGGLSSKHRVSLILKDTGAARALRATAAGETIEASIFARVALRNLELALESST